MSEAMNANALEGVRQWLLAMPADRVEVLGLRADDLRGAAMVLLGVLIEAVIILLGG